MTVPPLPRPYESWGRYPKARPRAVIEADWACAPPDLGAISGPLLPYGLGRSYGDVCLNEGGVLIDTRGMARFIAFDRETGRLECEAGVPLSAILELVVPDGWFLPVTPGTKHVTIGGAIANDVHGKNHHQAGAFGCHVLGFELLRSNGEKLRCRPGENGEMFRATIGGLGLTGLILSAEIQLRRVPSPHVVVERMRYGGLADFFALSEDSDRRFEYTVAWVDSLARGRRLGRGVFMRGNHARPEEAAGVRGPARLPGVPLEAPNFVLAHPTIRAFNTVYYYGATKRVRRRVVHYDPFFYPLDVVDRWNLLYGRRGFLQYQSAIPPEHAAEVTREMLEVATSSHEGSFLAVLKQFGATPSPGMLSFPRPGTTLALDLAFRGPTTLALCERLDELVAQAGGAVYPCKDARMSAGHFARFFPKLAEFRRQVDPKFSSSFWRRVNGEREAASRAS